MSQENYHIILHATCPGLDFWRKSVRVFKMIVPLHLAQKLGISGATPPLPNVFMACTWTSLNYLYLHKLRSFPAALLSPQMATIYSQILFIRQDFGIVLQLHITRQMSGDVQLAIYTYIHVQ